MLPAKTLFTLAAAGVLAAQGAPSLAQRIAARLRPNDLKADVSFLASDALQGRATPSPGLDMAAEYIAAQFRRAGLEPVGDDGYFQTANYQYVKPDLQGLQFTLGTARAAEGVVMINEAAAAELQNAPAFKVSLSNAASLDALTADQVRGKVLMVELSPAPGAAGFQAQRRLMTLAAKLEPAMVVMVRGAAAPGNPNVRPQLRDAGQAVPKAPILTVVDKAIFDALAAASPGPMEATVSAHVAAPVLQPVRIRNVVGLLRGSDAQLKDTYVVVTGHYDHLGVRPNPSGDNIYNGANDNATGCGILLELARVFAQASQRPRRSILFASVTAEEQGLLGSEYLGNRPPLPASKISLDLNYDDIPPLGSPEEVDVSGSERTTFYKTVEATAKDFRLTIRPDAHPEAGHYYRSDHFSLARVGIPSFSINEGVKYKGHTEAWGLAKQEEFNTKHYHQPSDEYHPDMDFTGDGTMARFGFALAWQAAMQPRLVGWERGDEFEAARLKGVQ